MKLQKELTAASSVPLVLSILAEGDSYGYAIIQRVKELSGGEIEWTDGMLYPVLHWLEDHELVRSKWVDSPTGRKRKYYHLKSEGKQALRKQQEQWTLVNSVLNQLWSPRHA
jgi:PadR family transcriptional regulator PadR